MVLKIQEMDVVSLAKFFAGGCSYLEAHKDAVNALNVFPVPDGDTGINMYLTINSAVNHMQKGQASSVSVLMNDFAMGALMGARGNSGVILSQIFRGMSKGLSKKKVVTAVDFAEAMQKGVDLSYKSVMKPVEGTILTVFREFASAALKAASSDDIVAMLEDAMVEGEKSLANTQNILPALKEAGVVDAGGKGLLLIFAGGLKVLKGEDLGVDFAANSVANTPSAEGPAYLAADGDIEFGFCTQLLIKGENLPIDEVREHLSQDPPGDSLLVVGDDQIIKIHYHNNQPWRVLEYCSQFGTLHDIIIDNMRDQHHPTMALEGEDTTPVPAEAPAGAPVEAPLDTSECAVVAVCAGDGLIDLFGELGAQVISGGQTMNPSAEDILSVINSCPAREVVILPNNSNIIMTAKQATKLADKKVVVVETKYVTQGISAMIAFDPDGDADTNAENMREAMANVQSGELTFAVRSAKIDGFMIEEGDMLALLDGKISVCGKDLEETLCSLVGRMVENAHDANLISLFYGNSLGENEADIIAGAIAKQFPDFDVECHYGGQPLYYFLISME